MGENNGYMTFLMASARDSCLVNDVKWGATSVGPFMATAWEVKLFILLMTLPESPAIIISDC